MPNVGLSIVEAVAQGAIGFREPSKRNIGLLGQFVRGAGFSPVKVTSEEEFRNIFGGQNSAFYGPMIVKSIFREAGNAPVTLYIARVVNDQFVAATKTVTLEGSGSTAVTMKVTAGYKGIEDPGAWGNNVKVTLYSMSYKMRGMYTLVVECNGDTETYNYATFSELQAAVNTVSKYAIIEFTGNLSGVSYTNLTGTITATTNSNAVTGSSTTFTTQLAVGSAIFNGSNVQIGTVAAIIDNTHLILTGNAMVAVSGAAAKKRADTAYAAELVGGVDGTVIESDFYPVRSVSRATGLACFDGYDVQIIACTEYHSLTMAQQLKAYLDERKNPIGVINLPYNADEGTAELYANALQSNDKSFIAGYLGWVETPDENGHSVLIPAIGSILGAAYIRTPYVQGDFIHIPPAGTDSLFNFVTKVIPPRIEQATINRLVQQFSCNIIQYADNLGYYVGTSRTYSLNPLYQSVHIRLQTSYYLRYLNASMRFTEQKPNTPELKREALITLRQFFKTEYDNGALERSVPFSEAYQGICDASNNPPTQDRKLLNIDVLWIPTECVESVQITLQRNDGILSVIEAEE